MTAITLNLEDSLVDFLRSFTKKRNMTQKELFENYLQHLKKEQLKKELIGESKAIAIDIDIQQECAFFAESGLEEYNSFLK
ncbi:hypothetical protein MK079_04755 [Candidatus Gracilibacteria bacterium]|nr:hypothetical protein [Candidatus Gracilibacteria bacterium]